MGLRELRIRCNRRLVLADRPRRIALALERQTTREVCVPIVTKRTHLAQHGVWYARPPCAELARAGERGARFIRPPQIAQREPARVPRRAELGVQPDSRVEGRNRLLVLAAGDVDAAQTVSRVRFGGRLTGQRVERLLARRRGAGLEQRVRKLRSRAGRAAGERASASLNSAAASSW